MNRFLAGSMLAAAALGFSGAALAEGHELPYQFRAHPDDLQSVQRGAANFMSYCSGCHSMRNLRYSRMVQDLKIPEDMFKENLMFTAEKIGEPIKSAMPADSAKWFGQQPPDLTLEARMRGPEWVYNYLLTFYIDDKRPMGVNNLVLPNASMPHVLWELQGWQVKEEVKKAEGEAAGHEEGHHGPGLKLAQPGKLSPEKYSAFVEDTVNFLIYAAEPGRAARISLGVKVMLYLIVFTAFAYALKKEYWKDVH